MRTTREFLDVWVADGRISAAQHEAIEAVVSRRRISLFVELNALLYLGVLSFVGGLAWTARAYSDRWGDRFDNRFVLSLALATLGSWFGVRVSRFHWFDDRSVRVLTLAYGVVVAVLGGVTWQVRVKRHFLDTYLQVAAVVVLSTLTWSVLESHALSPWLLASVAGSAACVWGGIRWRRFSFIVYGAFAGYVSVSREVLRHVSWLEASFLYVIVSAGLMILSLVILSREMGRRR